MAWLDEIKERSVAATLGPWLKGEGNDNAIYSFVEPDDFEALINYADGQFFNRADAEFAAHAYRDVQKLLIEVERLRKIEDAAIEWNDSINHLEASQNGRELALTIADNPRPGSA